MIFKYVVLTKTGEHQEGEIDSLSQSEAITSLQERGYIVISVIENKKTKKILDQLKKSDHISLKELVLTSRQLATLFQAQISVVKAFYLVGENSENNNMSLVLKDIGKSLEGGVAIDEALKKYPEVFSDFYIGMVRAGSESGKLQEVFAYLADYLERQYEITSKVKNALVYPSFIVATFILVMILVFVLIIPRIGEILIESGQVLPWYTKAVINLSDFFIQFGWLLLVVVLSGAFYLVAQLKKASTQQKLDIIKLKIPYFKELYKKVYLSRLSDNLNTMLGSGIPVLRALEITKGVIGNSVYENILDVATEEVKGGKLISEALSHHEEVPQLMVQMIKTGEESGSLNVILETLTRFYKREVDSAVETIISLIEPAMIIMLAVGVGVLLVSVLMPMYNISTGIV